MHTTITWCRRGLAFCTGAKADSGRRSVLSPKERSGDRESLPSSHALGWGLWGTFPTPYPDIPCIRERFHILEEDGI